MNGRVLVCGSRHWMDYGLMASRLNQIKPHLICHGGAWGADDLAGLWAKRKNVPCWIYRADWRTHGKAAGAIRNLLMLDEFEPELVVAFKDEFDETLRHGGTEHMVKIARQAGVLTMIVSHARTDVLR